MATIKPERVLSDLRTLAAFGAFKSGVHRPTLSAQDIAAREWFAGRMREAGLDAEIDGIANILGKSRASGRKVLPFSDVRTAARCQRKNLALLCLAAPRNAQRISS